MDPIAAWITLACSVVLLLLTTFVLRQRLRQPAVDLLFAVSGAGVAIGGLLFLDDVSTASWVLTPILLALGAVVHARALFAGDGPFRT